MSTEKPPYDPKLRQAMAEIRAICRKHDIGGAILLTSETHSEFAYLIDLPSWSIVRFEGDGGVRLRSTDLPTREAKKHGVEMTAGMLFALRDLAINTANDTGQLCSLLEQHFEIEHKSLIGRRPDFTAGDLQ